MTIKEFHLLDIVVYDDGKEIFKGKCEDAPEDLKSKQIKIDGVDDKELKVSII